MAGLPCVPMYQDKRPEKKNHKLKDTQTPKQNWCPEGGPLFRPCPHLLPFHLSLFPFSHPVPRQDCDHLPSPRFAEEGQNSFSRPHVLEEQGHAASYRAFPPGVFPDLFPELLDLGPLGLTVHKEMLAGLPLILTAPPAPIWRDLVHPPAEVIPHGRVPRQELVVTAREGIAFMTEFLSELWTLRRAVATSAVDVIYYPRAYPRCPCLGGRSGHVCEARFAEVSPQDCVT